MDDKETIINTLLNRVVVYNDRIEIFINLLPYEDANAEMLITNEDLATYGLLENEENEKIAHTSDFPSDKTFGDSFEVKGELFSCSKVTVAYRLANLICCAMPLLPDLQKNYLK